MKLTIEEIDRLIIDDPTDELMKFAQYGDFMNCESPTPDDVMLECREVLKEQISYTFEAIHDLHEENPIAIHFWEDKPDKGWPKITKPSKGTRNIGWTGWTDRKRQPSLPS